MKSIIIAHQSLSGMPYRQCMDMIPALKKHGFDTVYVYKHLEEQAALSGFKNNYLDLMNLISEQGLKVIELPLYGPDELLYMLHSPSFRAKYGLSDELYFSPTNSWYIAFSANLLNYKGKLYIFESIAKVFNDTLISFKDFDYTAFQLKKRWLDTGLSYAPLPVPEHEIKQITYKIGDRTFVEPFQHYNPKMQFGVEGFVYRSIKNPDYMIKIYWAADADNDKEEDKKLFKMPCEFIASKIKSMMKFYKKTDGIVLPVSLVYSSDGYVIGYVMKAVSGQHIRHRDFLKVLNEPVKYVNRLFSLLVQCEVIGLRHRDLIGNIMYDTENGNVYIIDTASAEFGTYPATTKMAGIDYGTVSCCNISGTPQAYRSGDNSYFPTLELSYQAFMLLLSSQTNVESRRKPAFFMEDADGNTFINPARNEISNAVIRKAAYYQYDKAFPSHFFRLYEVSRGKETFDDIGYMIEELGYSHGEAVPPVKLYPGKKTKDKTKVYNLRLEEKMPENVSGDDYLRGDYAGYVPADCNLAEYAINTDAEKHDSGVRNGDSEKKRNGIVFIPEKKKDVPVRELKMPTINFKEIYAFLYYVYAFIMTKLFFNKVETESVRAETDYSNLSRRERTLRNYILLKKTNFQRPLIISLVLALMTAGCIFIYFQIQI